LLLIKPGFYPERIIELAKKFGDCVNFYEYHFATPNVFVCDPLDTAFILGKGQQYFGKRVNIKQGLRWLLGESMLVADGTQWKHRREALNPAFHFATVSKMQSTMIHRVHLLITKLDAHIISQQQQQTPIDLSIEFQNLAQDVLGLVGFNFDFNCQLDTSLRYRKSLQCLAVEARARFFRLSPTFLWNYIPSIKQQYADSQKSKALLVNVIQDIIKQRVENQTKSNKQQQQQQQHDLLQFMLDSTTMNHNQIVDEMILFLFAGTDTTSSLLTSCIYFLMHNESAAAKLYCELDTTTTTTTTIAGTAASVLTELPYMTAFIKETLRLRPPAPIVTREPLERVTLPSGLRVHPGVSLTISPLLQHRSELLWGEDVLEFKPERWINTPEEEEEGEKENEKEKEKEKEKKEKKKIPNAGIYKTPLTTAYIPFVSGKRNCIGQNVARLETSIVLSMLLKRYRFQLPENANIITHTAGTLVYTNGLPVYVTFSNNK
jgi:cytochrome P450